MPNNMRLVIFLFFCITSSVYAQSFDFKKDQIEDSIRIVDVLDSNFYSLIDTVLIIESKCTFNPYTVAYSIYIEDTIILNKYITFVQIQVDPYINTSSYLGVFKYKGINFFLEGDLSKNKVFRISNKKYFYAESYEGIPPNDDSWPIHNFWYDINKFYYINSVNSTYRCK